MKAHADREAFGKLLMLRRAGKERGPVARFNAGRKPTLPHEIVLKFDGVDAVALRVARVSRRRTEHFREFAIEIDQVLRDCATLDRVAAQKLRRRAPAQ